MTERSMRQWAPEDRPREKLLLKGTASLSDAELLALLIGTGHRTCSAIDLAKGILQDASNNLQTLACFSVRELMRSKGIGKAKALTIVAAMELGRRKREGTTQERPQINSSGDAYNQLYGVLADLPHEEFWVLLLNRANKVIRRHRISTGGVAGTVADPKMIFQCALEHLASGIIVAHNHPSGNLVASQQDIDLTNKLIWAGQMLDIRVIDHLILAGNNYYSFADDGKIRVT